MRLAPLSRVRRAENAGTTVLIGAFLLATGTLLTLVFVAGYLVRLLARSEDAERTLPGFDDWAALFSTGARALGLWLGVLVTPLVVLAAWIESYWVATDGLTSPGSQTVVNAAVGATGSLLGGGVAARDLLRIVQDVLVATGLVTAFTPPYGPFDSVTAATVGGVVLVAVLFGSQYLVAALFLRLARTGRVVSALAPRPLLATCVNPDFAWRAVVVGLFVLLGAVGPILWNTWRASTPGLDFQYVSLGFIPVMSVGTPVGVKSAAFLLVVSAVDFLLIVAAFTILGGTKSPAGDY